MASSGIQAAGFVAEELAGMKPATAALAECGFSWCGNGKSAYSTREAGRLRKRKEAVPFTATASSGFSCVRPFSCFTRDRNPCRSRVRAFLSHAVMPHWNHDGDRVPAARRAFGPGRVGVVARPTATTDADLQANPRKTRRISTYLMRPRQRSGEGREQPQAHLRLAERGLPNEGGAGSLTD